MAIPSARFMPVRSAEDVFVEMHESTIDELFERLQEATKDNNLADVIKSAKESIPPSARTRWLFIITEAVQNGKNKHLTWAGLFLGQVEMGQKLPEFKPVHDALWESVAVGSNVIEAKE